MARWTETYQDIKHLQEISQQTPFTAIMELELYDGTRIEGVIRRINQGNNAGRGGWKYYGELEIETKDKQRWVIDYLDIKRVTNASTAQKMREYEELGLITIV